MGLPVVGCPWDAELGHPLGLDEPIDNAKATVVRVPLKHRLKRHHDLLNRL
jgi:hypothetical protein